MLTGDICNRIDQVWNAFWAGGVANPLKVIEQITYLLLILRLDDLETLGENKANRLQQSMELVGAVGPCIRVGPVSDDC